MVDWLQEAFVQCFFLLVWGARKKTKKEPSPALLLLLLLRGLWGTGDYFALTTVISFAFLFSLGFFPTALFYF